MNGYIIKKPPPLSKDDFRFGDIDEEHEMWSEILQNQIQFAEDEGKLCNSHLPEILSSIIDTLGTMLSNKFINQSERNEYELQVREINKKFGKECDCFRKK